MQTQQREHADGEDRGLKPSSICARRNGVETLSGCEVTAIRDERSRLSFQFSNRGPSLRGSTLDVSERGPEREGWGLG